MGSHARVASCRWGGWARATCIYLAGKTECQYITIQEIKSSLSDKLGDEVVDFEIKLLQVCDGRLGELLGLICLRCGCRGCRIKLVDDWCTRTLVCIGVG